MRSVMPSAVRASSGSTSDVVANSGPGVDRRTEVVAVAKVVLADARDLEERIERHVLEVEQEPDHGTQADREVVLAAGRGAVIDDPGAGSEIDRQHVTVAVLEDPRMKHIV